MGVADELDPRRSKQPGRRLARLAAEDRERPALRRDQREPDIGAALAATARAVISASS
jgi:hypothetical protein